MRYLLAAVIALTFAVPAQASGGHITTASFDGAWVSGVATFSVYNLACRDSCSWRAVAAVVPAVYPCPDEPYLGVGSIAWESDDYRMAGTVSATVVGFSGPAKRARICLYLDRRGVDDADHYLLTAEATFADPSGPAEVFEALVADPRPKPKRHHRAKVKRSRTRTSTATVSLAGPPGSGTSPATT